MVDIKDRKLFAKCYSKHFDILYTNNTKQVTTFLVTGLNDQWWFIGHIAFHNHMQAMDLLKFLNHIIDLLYMITYTPKIIIYDMASSHIGV
jgi:hypothetical protein